MPTEYRVVSYDAHDRPTVECNPTPDREKAEHDRALAVRVQEYLGRAGRVELQSREVGEWKAVEPTEETP